MRTTLTIEPAIAQEIRKRMAERNVTLKALINEALREGLMAMAGKPKKKDYRFKIKPHDFAFRPGIDLDKLNQFADDLEDEERVAKMAR